MDCERPVDELLRCEQPLSRVLTDLAVYGWDSNKPFAELKPSHIRDALLRYIHAELSAEQIEEWAHAIECREDIAYEPSSRTGEPVFELANPVLMLPFGLERAQELLQLLPDS